MLHYFQLAVAAAVKIESQITISECRKAKKKKKKEGNLRMHVERGINRI